MMRPGERRKDVAGRFDRWYISSASSGSSSVVERHLAKVRVAGSSPVFRSI